MTHRLAVSALCLAVFFAAAVTGMRRAVCESVSDSCRLIPSGVPTTAFRQTLRSPAWATTEAARAALEMKPSRPVEVFSVSTPAPALSADASAVLAEQAALQMLATGNGLELASEQWTALAKAVLHAQAVRQAYEATIATPTWIGAGQCRVTIPAYPAAGDALRARFHRELHEALGAPVAGKIVGNLGAVLEGRFAGFGVSLQTLDFSADKASAETDYRVTRTVTFWNSIDATEQLTTRRETHFPGLEDPTGHAWGPFLTVLATGAAKNAGS